MRLKTKFVSNYSFEVCLLWTINVSENSKSWDTIIPKCASESMSDFFQYITLILTQSKIARMSNHNNK